MPDLSDAEARQLITTATDETLFVEAGAGTGKTTSLVSRILALIEGGVPVSQIAAITFTEKAAAELADRVRQKLEESSKAPEKAAHRDLYVRALDELDGAALQTLHSFAMRILSLYPLEAGLPPRLSLRDDVQATLAFRDRWNRFRDELLESRDLERPLLRGLTAGLRLKDLQEVADIFNENWERIAKVALPAAPEPTFDPDTILEPLRFVLSAPEPDEPDSLSTKLASLGGFIAAMESFSRELPHAVGERLDQLEIDFLRLLVRTEPLDKPIRPARLLGNSKRRRDLDHLRDAMKEAEAARNEMVETARSWVLCTLLPHVRDFVIASAEERRRAGELEFHDLLVLARDLLRDNPAVREALHRRYTRVLIDEFQDTDPIQVELAAFLASDDAAVSDWEAVSAHPGRLFFVGDPKQSIYRFRRADIELFKKARGAFSARHVALRKNFRCRPAIIEWVNEACGALFQGIDAGPDDLQADWIPLEPGLPPGKLPAVQLIGEPMPTGKGKAFNAADVRRREAEGIVAAVAAAVHENWLARDGKKDTVTRYADIAILLPTRTNSPAIERALADAGIPSRIESRSLLFAAQEIRDLTNILAAIDDPTDDVAVVAALRSPAFAVEDGELLAHANAGGRWDYTRPLPETSPEAMKQSMAALAELHEGRWATSIGALVERVIAGRKLLELSVASPRPREAWRRLRFVAEQARSLGDSGTVTSLRQFVQWLRTQAEERVLIAEAVANERDDDAVKILTVHAAKGLEFPIVILGGLGVERNFSQPKVAWGRDETGDETVAVRTGIMSTYFQTPGYEAFSDAEKHHSWLERDRLFYVAATRAKERLVVSVFHPEKSNHGARHAERKCMVAECLHALRDRFPGWASYVPGLPLGAEKWQTASDGGTAADRDAWLAERAARIERLGKARVLAATTIAHGEEVPSDEEEPEPFIEDQPWKKGRGGSSVGRAVHAVLQTLDLATGEGLAEIARNQAVAEGIADEAPRIARLVENCRTSNAVREALAGRHWRELYVGAPVEGALVEGFIDLLYESPEGLVVVDYKTDSVRSAAEVEQAMERYRLQGAAYAMVLEQALGRTVARCVFVFAEPKMEVEVAGLPSVMAEVRAEVRRRG
jgi:ATP-dependent exoDNAse (exonuclease V) beta subunit